MIPNYKLRQIIYNVYAKIWNKICDKNIVIANIGNKC